MGMIGEIFALVGLHVDQASFAQASGDLMAVGESADKLKSKFDAVTLGIMAAPAAIVTAMAGIGMSVATNMQDASLTLQTVYNGVDTAREKFTWLRTFAAETPFEFPGLLQATIMLRNAGLEAEEMLPTFGNAASVFNRSIEDTSAAVISAMNGEWESMKSFGISSMIVTKQNAESLGVSVEEAGKRALITTDKYGKQIVATVDQTNKQAVAGTISDLWEKYEGQMQQRSQTISGLYSTLKDNIGMGLGAIVGFQSDMTVRTFSLMGVMQSLMEVAVNLTTSFVNMSPAAQVFISLLGAGVFVISAAAVAWAIWGVAVDAMNIKLGIMDLTLGSALLPITAIVIGAALLGTALWELNERTGILTRAWNFLKDIAVVLGDAFSRLWEGFSREGSYSIRLLVEYFNNLKTIIADIAEKYHLDDLFNFYWDISPIRLAYEALKKIWEMLTEWAGGVHDKAETIRKAHGDVGDSAITMAEDVGTATGDVATDEGNMATSAVTASGDTQTAHKGILQSLGDWVTGSNKATETITQNDETVKKSAKETLTVYQQSVKDMLTTQQSLLDLKNEGGVGGGGDSTTQKALSSEGKGIEVDTGTKEYGSGIIGKDAATGQEILTYYKEVDGQIKAQTVSLAYLSQIGVNTFKTQDGLLKIVAFDHTSNMEAINEEMVKEQEKGNKVIPLDMDIARNKKNVTTVTLENAKATDEATKATDANTTANTSNAKATGEVGKNAEASSGQVDKLKKSEDDVKHISLEEARLETLKPGNAAVESRGKVETLDKKSKELNSINLNPFSVQMVNPGLSADGSEKKVSGLGKTSSGLNGISISDFIDNLYKPGDSANDSEGDVKNLNTNTNDLNSISLTDIYNTLLTPGDSAGLSDLAVGILATSIFGLNGIVIATIVSTLLNPGSSADTSKGKVDNLAASILGLNNIDLNLISSKLSAIYNQAVETISKVGEAAENYITGGDSGSSELGRSSGKKGNAQNSASNPSYSGGTKINTQNITVLSLPNGSSSTRGLS